MLVERLEDIAKDIVEEEKNKEMKIVEKCEEYKDILYKNNFTVCNGKLLMITERGTKEVSNFIPIITRKTNYINDIDKYTKYGIKAILVDEDIELEEIEINKKELNSFDFVIGSAWDRYAVIFGNSKMYLRQLAQIISREVTKEENIYTQTGFKRIGDKLVYLYHGGAIGDLADVKADLSMDKLEQYAFTEKEFDIVDALNTSYSILNLADDKKITIPLLATTYLAPIVSLLQEEGIFSDYVLFLVGKTGSKKSSTAAIAGCHFGDFDRNTFKTHLRNTLNSLEKKAYVLSDTIFIADDLNPEKGKDKIEVFNKLLGDFGDRVGRGRMSSDGISLKTPYVARGLCIATGEYIPNLPESRLARAICIDIKQNSIKEDVLSKLQENKAKLSFCMKVYIKWIIINEKWVKETAKQIKQEMRKRPSNNMHGRTKEAIDSMYIGFYMFLYFLRSYQVINQEIQNQLLNQAYDILFQVGEKQREEIESTNPITMFYNAIEEMLQTDRIYVLEYDNGLSEKNNPRGKFVGYIDRKESCYYFYPEIIYSEIANFYKRSDITFPLSKASLWKYLDQDGLIYKTDVSRKTVERTNPLTKTKVRVIAIKFTDEHSTLLENNIQHNIDSEYLQEDIQKQGQSNNT